MTVRLVPAVDVAALAPSVHADRLAAHLWELGCALSEAQAEQWQPEAEPATSEPWCPEADRG